MFSPEASISSGRSSLRNPRRRQRKDSDGLQQQPRRKRSKLSEEARFEAPPAKHINGNGSATMNGHVNHASAGDSMVIVDMPVRDKKPSPKRSLRDDAAIYLTKTDNYNVKKLPSFPSRLSNGFGTSMSALPQAQHRLTAAAPFRASANPSAGLALALTHEHALAWDYTAGGLAKVVTLNLTFALKPSDPLPFGALVRNGPTNDFGILAIAPSSGNITFWDNVDTAEARSHFPQRHQAVDGMVGKMHSGETITDLVDVEQAGYVLIFSSGRLAQVTLRDSQGRPSIAVHFIQGGASTGGSFFSFKGLLGGGIRKTIVSVKARPSISKGQMEVITATRNGVFQLWDLSWSGQHVFKSEIDAHAEVFDALQAGTAPEARGENEAHILDFSILKTQKASKSTCLLVLVALIGRGVADYSLLELDLTGEGGIISRAIPVQNYHQSQLPKEPSGTLLLPHPEHTAFIQFPGAIVVSSILELEETPDAQLLSDTGRPTLPFQDTIYFRQEPPIHFSGHALEHSDKKARQSSVIVFVQNYGALQVSASLPTSDCDDMSRLKVTAQSKLEQATFYSTIPDNIIDFSVKSRYTFDQMEVEKAAEAISAGVLSSSYENLEKVTSSMDEQIRHRSSTLRTLIDHLQSDYPPLSFPTRWRLLTHAEKLESALHLWHAYEARLRNEDETHDPLVPHMLEVLHEKFKTQLHTELGENDWVRQFFLKDIVSIQQLTPWAYQVIRTFYSLEDEESRPSVMWKVSEANDIILAVLEAAYAFRRENARVYGIGSDSIQDCILLPAQGFDLIKEPWTATYNIVAAVRALVDLGRRYALTGFESDALATLAQKLAKDNPRLVDICCRVHIERYSWGFEQSDERRKVSAKELQEDFLRAVRPKQIYHLLEIGQAPAGMSIAERYNDMETLAKLVWNELTYLEGERDTTQSKMEEAECIVKLNRLRERTRSYFTRHGSHWATAYYNKFIREHRTGELLGRDNIDPAALTSYLRSHASRARIMWINEVLREKDYGTAGECLMDSAAKNERNAWCQRTELSMAKLALLCLQQPEQDGKQSAGDQQNTEVSVASAAERLDYAKVQDQLFDRLTSIIKGALDEESAVQLLMNEFGQGLQERPAHQQLLQQGFEDLVNTRVLEPSLLIDVLTLMTYDEEVATTPIALSDQFALALKALTMTWEHMDRTTRASTHRLIWKRLLIRDDWAELNNTNELSDEQVTAILNDTTAGMTLKAYIKLYDENAMYQVVWPNPLEDLFGAGCTEAELSVRFGSEDLRKPIISDNLADDETLREFAERYRLGEWFEAAMALAKRQVAAAKTEEQARVQQEMEIAIDYDELGGLEEDFLVSEIEAAASEAFEGDDEQSVADQDEDEEMEDA
ncbi:hypothetical protein EJ04DRAFT_521319 [Polyplosphaeria fusca]|uniref:Nuclear pore complex protein Nup133 n=1 Tax=Polyplosphaeria fusca TaxID=682080 RepID=A0A9P4R0U9_9PLEO|nr:hypothetical protein EJ04DRAFT_521319 [Polyplosphaeria fusca]